MSFLFKQRFNCFKYYEFKKLYHSVRSLDAYKTMNVKNIQNCSRSTGTSGERPIVYITRPDVPKVGLELLEEKFTLKKWSKEEPVPREELLKNVEGVAAVFCMLTDKIDKEVLDKAGPCLKVIGTMSVGFDHIDIEECKKRNIRIGYTPGVLTDATAELTVALLLAASRNLIQANHEVHNGNWKAWAPVWMCGPEIKNKTIGIVGYGRIGQQVGRLLKPFKPAKFLIYSRTKKPNEAKELDAEEVTFDRVIRESDFVICTLALTKETSEIFNESTFNKMKKTAIFINTSRGGVVNQTDLIKALESKTIYAAGLDVMTPEPLPLDNPLMKLKNCVLLPHIGSASTETRIEMSQITANNIIAAVCGGDMVSELV